MDKYWEAKYFLFAMIDNYHDPHAFRYNLNAFIQALRNVTFMLQSEETKPPEFVEWYAARTAAMADDLRLRRMVKARNCVVKQQMLESASTLRIGVFQGRRFKLGVGGDVEHFRTSEELLSRAQGFYAGFMIDPEHSHVGEQIGVQREWKVPAIGEGEVVEECAAALRSIAVIVEDAHLLWGSTVDASFELPDLVTLRTLLETDVDPQLAVKWGWAAPDGAR